MYFGNPTANLTFVTVLCNLIWHVVYSLIQWLETCNSLEETRRSENFCQARFISFYNPKSIVTFNRCIETLSIAIIGPIEVYFFSFLQRKCKFCKAFFSSSIYPTFPYKIKYSAAKESIAYTCYKLD